MQNDPLSPICAPPKKNYVTHISLDKMSRLKRFLPNIHLHKKNPYVVIKKTAHAPLIVSGFKLLFMYANRLRNMRVMC